MSDGLERVSPAGAGRDPVSAGRAGPAKPVLALPKASGPVALRVHDQFRMPQIPPSAMDKLSSNEIAKVLESSLASLDAHDQQVTRIALDRTRIREDADKRQIYVGGSLAALGLVLVGILARLGEGDVAMMLVVFLATVIGVTIGGKKGR